MKQRWQQLNQRERVLVLAMSALVLVFLLYSLGWQPLQQNIANTEKKLQQQQQLLAWVQQNTAFYQQTSSGAKRGSGSITSIVNRTANAHQITVTRMQPQGDDLQVWIDQVPFNQLLTWLAQLAEQEGLQVQAIDLNEAEQAGVVQVRRLQLGR